MKTDTRHTPGPWATNVDCDGIEQIINPETHEIVVNADITGAGDANASVILAAPEMLETLRDLYKHCAMVHNKWGEGSNQKQADAAIKRGADLLARFT